MRRSTGSVTSMTSRRTRLHEHRIPSRCPQDRVAVASRRRPRSADPRRSPASSGVWSGRCGSGSTATKCGRRLALAEQRGLSAATPTRWQLVFGGFDMLRFVIEPAARDYYEQQGISFGFHQFLRVLDDPVSMIDPTGFLSERDTIIGHVMQVVHLNPIYDLQLLELFPSGLDELENAGRGDGRGHAPAPPNDRRDRRGPDLSRAPARLHPSLPARPRDAAAGTRRSRHCATTRPSPQPSAPSRRFRVSSRTATACRPRSGRSLRAGVASVAFRSSWRGP